jgi:hypothetical protein
MRSKKDLWVEMSIREIWTQCHFAEIAYSHIDPKASAGTDLVFSSIHSLLSHSAVVSKMLKAKFEESSISIGDVLNVPLTSIIHEINFRNSLEHYDKELKKWIEKYPADINVGTYNIGPKNMLEGNIVFVSHYDPATNNFTFVDEDFNLKNLSIELSNIKSKADGWVKKMEAQEIEPPFIP